MLIGGFDSSLHAHLRAKLGDQAEEAIGEAITRADELATVWEVEIDGYLPGATNALVLTCHRGNLEFVLKVPVTECAIEDHLPALFAFCEQGGIEVFESDLESGAALLPRLRPGTDLAEVAEEEAVEVCAELVLKLRSTTGDGQPAFAFETLPASLRRPSPKKPLSGLGGFERPRPNRKSSTAIFTTSTFFGTGTDGWRSIPKASVATPLTSGPPLCVTRCLKWPKIPS